MHLDQDTNDVNPINPMLKHWTLTVFRMLGIEVVGEIPKAVRVTSDWRIEEIGATHNK